jgi:hypothetical protein
MSKSRLRLADQPAVILLQLQDEDGNLNTLAPASRPCPMHILGPLVRVLRQPPPGLVLVGLCTHPSQVHAYMLPLFQVSGFLRMPYPDASVALPHVRGI